MTSPRAVASPSRAVLVERGLVERDDPDALLRSAKLACLVDGGSPAYVVERLGAGAVVAAAGDPCEYVACVVEGAAAYAECADGDDDFGPGDAVGEGAVFEASPRFLATVVAVDGAVAVRVPRSRYEAARAARVADGRAASAWLGGHCVFEHVAAATRARWLRGVERPALRKGALVRGGSYRNAVFLLEKGTYRVVAARSADEASAVATLYGGAELFGVVEHVDARAARAHGRRDLRVLSDDAACFEVKQGVARRMLEDPTIRGAWAALARHRAKWEEATVAVIEAARGSRARVTLDHAQMKVARYLCGPHLVKGAKHWSKLKGAVAPRDGGDGSDAAAPTGLDAALTNALTANRLKRQSAPGQDKRAKFPTSKAPLSADFHSFRLIFGRAIISWNGLEAWMLFPERARAEHSR